MSQSHDLARIRHSRDPAEISAFLFRWCGSAERPHRLLELHREVAPDDGASFWRLVAAEWSGFDAIPHREFIAAFRRHRQAWTAEAMREADHSAYRALPGTLTVYRGQSALAAIGLSWTLRREVAEGFARGHRDISAPSPVILEARILKRSIALLCTDRDEAEVVLFRPPRFIVRAAL